MKAILSGLCPRHAAVQCHFGFGGTVDMQADEAHSVFAVMGSLPKWLGFGQAVEIAVSIRSTSSKVRT